ncbi:MAG: hypothetical protein PHN56_02330 [Candidatus Nanoarchaeia archaeon]|nr:hypothetical protein [Candidatus Nanoarchaeia archaeon]
MINETTLNEILEVEIISRKEYVPSDYNLNHEIDLNIYFMICGATEKEKLIFNEKNYEFIKLYQGLN